MKLQQYILAASYACIASARVIRNYTRGSFPQSCRPVSGTFQIDAENLFPEAADWDPVHCKLYAGALYNASAIQYDPYTTEIKYINFPNISGNTSYHVAGVDYDASSGSVFFAANAAPAWNQSALGQNLTGPNYLVKYDTKSDTVSWAADLSTFQTEVLAESGRFVAGFQDMAEDPRGNIYAIASFGDAIARVSPDGGSVGVFYDSGAQNTSVLGIGALFTTGNTLVVAQSRSYGFLVFDTLALDHAVPKVVQPDSLPPDLQQTWCDSLVAPSRYNGSVALCAIDGLNGVGGVAVFESQDRWQSVSYKGYVEVQNNLTTGSTPTATVAIGDSYYVVEEFFQPSGEPTQPKYSFPFFDITAQVEELLH